MKLLKNKFFIGTLCIILGLLFGFVAVPMTISSGESAEITAVRMIGDVKAGMQLTADMVETVTVLENVIEGGIGDVSSVIGQYARTDLYAGDYLTAAKLTAAFTEDGILSAGTAKGKVVVSITLPSLASGVSGRLLPGDIVMVMVVPQGSTGQSLALEPDDATQTTASGAYIDPVLQYLEVCLVTTGDGSDAIVTAEPTEEEKNTLPVTVSFYATLEQALKLAELEQTGSIHLAFVARGEATSDYVPDNVLVGMEVG